jgi:hypothetical protein
MSALKCFDALNSILPPGTKFYISPGKRHGDGYYKGMVMISNPSFTFSAETQLHDGAVEKLNWTGSEELAQQVLNTLRAHEDELGLSFSKTMIIPKDAEKAIQTYVTDFERRVRALYTQNPQRFSEDMHECYQEFLRFLR